jgi:hypothetical protein
MKADYLNNLYSDIKAIEGPLIYASKKEVYIKQPKTWSLSEKRKKRDLKRKIQRQRRMLSELANFRRSGAVSAPPLCFVYPRRTTAARNNERARCSRGSFSQYAQHYLLIFYKPQHWLGFRRPRLRYHNLCSQRRRSAAAGWHLRISRRE